MSHKKNQRIRIREDQILSALVPSGLTLSELSKKLNKTASSLQRPLEKLLERGIIFKLDKKYYRKEVTKSQDLLLRKLCEGPKTSKDLFEDAEVKIQFKDIQEIEEALQKLAKVSIERQPLYSITPDGRHLVANGNKKTEVSRANLLLIRKLMDGAKTAYQLFEDPEILKRSATVDLLETELEELVAISSYVKSDFLNILTPTAAVSLKRCPFCLQEIEKGEWKKIRMFLSDFNWELDGNRRLSWESNEIHVRCLYRLLSKRLKESDLEHLEGGFCNFCGLPLNPLLLRDFFILSETPIKSLVRHLNSTEIACIESSKEYANIQELCYHWLDTLVVRRSSQAYHSLYSRSDLESFYRHSILNQGIKIDEFKPYFESLDVNRRLDQLWDVLYKKLEENERKIDYYIEKLCGPPNLFYKNLQAFYSFPDNHNISNLNEHLVFSKYQKNDFEQYLQGVPAVDSAHSLFFCDKEGNEYHAYCYELQKHWKEGKE